MEWFGIVVIAVIAIVLVVRLLSAPIRLAGKLLINTLVGFAVLFLLNFAEPLVGLSLGINWVNAGGGRAGRAGRGAAAAH